MIKAIYSGITGMKTFQNALGITSNNIANAQTTGYKAKQAIFEDLLYQNTAARASNGGFAGLNPQSIGSGVRLAATKTDLTQGTINYTGGKADVAIEGAGYFIVGDINGDNVQYTRKGGFQLSEDNRLVNDSGQYVLGWNRNHLTGEMDVFSKPEPITIEVGTAVRGGPTTAATINGNLNFNMEIGESYRIQFPAYDNAGNKTNVEIEFVKTGPNEYRYVAIPSEAFAESEHVKSAFLNSKNVSALPDLEKGEYVIEVVGPATPGDKATINVYKPSDTGRTSPVITQQVDNVEQLVTLKDASGVEWMTIDFKKVDESTPSATSEAIFTVGDLGTVQFNTNGTIESITPDGVVGGPTQMEPEVSFVSPITGETNSFYLSLNEITNFNTDTSIGVWEVDGNPSATVRDFSISDDGIVLAQYSDGTVRPFGQIAMATFANEQGLTPVGSGNFIPSASSGEPTITTSGQAGVGNIVAQSLENSNVDLATEFVNLMMYQRAFQANSKIIQSSDEILTDLINLKR